MHRVKPPSTRKSHLRKIRVRIESGGQGELDTPPASPAEDTTHAQDTEGDEASTNGAKIHSRPEEGETEGELILGVEVCSKDQLGPTT